MLIGSKLFFGTLFVFLFSSSLIHAQPGQEEKPLMAWRVKKIPIRDHSGNNAMLVDSLPIVPASFSIDQVPPDWYRLDPLQSKLQWIRFPAADSVTIRYRVFFATVLQPLQAMRFDSVRQRYHVPAMDPKALASSGVSSWWGFSGIQAQGSLGRQIGFGNRQDAVVNSNLNVQLNGWLPDSIQLMAAIADQQLPIQPDGTTRQLQDFDQILLQFQKKDWQLQVGDIDLRENKDYFLNFYKRLQGVSFSSLNQLSKKTRLRSEVSGAIAKGRFTRQQLDIREGNQGPYRLQGPRNEFFLIILANSERVYYDGVLLQRGEDQDYVINYNTAEIRFTPKRPITKDSRVQVEFEYAERNYLNSNLFVSEEIQQGERWKFKLAVFQNTDAKNATINQTLDVTQRQFLATLGDSVQKAYYGAAVLDTGGKSAILYEKIHVGTDSFYRYSINTSVPRYSLAFTDIGQGQGDYIPDPAVANGKVYKYVPRINGVRQGRFEPVYLLIAPRQQQLVSASVNYTTAADRYFTVELATSKTDKNRFSMLDKGDDRGWAVRTQWKHRIGNLKDQQKIWQLSASQEYIQDRFEPLERIRNVEFSRDWGLPFSIRPVTENLLRLGLQWSQADKGGWDYLFTRYERSDRYTGTQQGLRHQENFRSWQFNNQFTYTHFSMPGTTGTFWRPHIDIRKQLPNSPNWKLGLGYQLENNSVRNMVSKLLQPASFHFEQLSFFLQSDEQRSNKYEFRFYTRSDYYVNGASWKKGDRSYNWQIETALLKSASQQLELSATIRRLDVLDPQLSVQKNDWTLLSRLQYRLRKWKGMLQGNWLYELGSGQEPKRDIVYVEVPAGQGEYAWNDYNQDGIQQLNEFELAQFPDQAKFVRLFTPTLEFIKSDQLTVNYHLDLDPHLYFGSSKQSGFKNFIARFTANSSWQYNRRTIADGHLSWNPFEKGLSDTSLVALQGILLNTISFNRFNTKWGMTISNYITESKAVLSYGFEDRQQREWLLKGRLNWNRNFAFLWELKKGEQQLSTPKYANRNYQIHEVRIKPQLQWIRGTSFQLTGSYQYQERANQLQWGGERSIAQVWMGEMRYSRMQQGILSSRISLHQINYPHASNSTVSYVMLDGLVTGTNWVWMLGYQKRLLDKLELSLQYDGRKAGLSKSVHMGRAGITALF